MTTFKAYLHTFGCRANQYDTEATRAALIASGVEIVPDIESADVAIYNSCAVTSEAEADLRKAVRRGAKRNTRLRSIVTGCAAATDTGTISSLPTVSDVIGGADLTALALALNLPSEAAAMVASHQTGSRALLRIQDGCDEHCTFCITTKARGANRSRSIEDVVSEASALAENHPEIVITGIHIGTFGIDTGTTLGKLMLRLTEELPDTRFRLSSLEATEVDADLTALFQGDPRRLAPYLHAPLQSGSDRLLKLMGRHWYTADTYAEAVLKVIDGREIFGLAADIIAGFPGETERDHEATLSLVERLPFTSLHVFPFSLRPGTAAERLPGRVDGVTITRRAKELRDLASLKGAAYRAKRKGQMADIVSLGNSSHRKGLTEDYLTIDVDPAIPRGVRFNGIIDS